MICKACNTIPNPQEKEDCFEKALDVLKQHYLFYKNALQQRDLELQQFKERNESLHKAMELLQKQQQPAKRFKSQGSDDGWLAANNCANEERVTSDLSLTDDEPIGATNLNMALHSEQLFDTSAFSPAKNGAIISSSSEFVISPRVKARAKSNKQRDALRNGSLERSKSDWHTKGRNSPSDKSWAMKFLKPSTTLKTSNSKTCGNVKKTDKRLCLSLKKTNPSKIKQSLINFNKSKDAGIQESDTGDDIIEASPVVVNKNLKTGRSWAQRSGLIINANSNNSTIALANVATKTDDNDKTIDHIVFDFSPTKKTDSSMDLKSCQKTQPKQINFDNEISTDCTSLANDHLGITSSKTDTSSVVILTPTTQDIIFVDDTCSDEADIDTMDLLADIMKTDSKNNLENLRKYESKSIQKQNKQNKDSELFKKPGSKAVNVKEERITQEQIQLKEMDNKPSSSKNISEQINKANKPQNPSHSSKEREEDDDDDEDEDFMPKPFKIKQEPECAKNGKKLTIKERFNIECEDCEKLINFLDDRLTDAQIREHLDKCKRHNNMELLRQNTPEGFWNPFILSFQADDPRNEVLIDNRFKHNNL